MSTPAYRNLLSLAVTLLSLVHVFASEPEVEELDIRYAVIGACLGALFGVIFIVFKLCMLKKGMLDTFSDSGSFNMKSMRQGDGDTR